MPFDKREYLDDLLDGVKDVMIDAIVIVAEERVDASYLDKVRERHGLTGSPIPFHVPAEPKEEADKPFKDHLEHQKGCVLQLANVYPGFAQAGDRLLLRRACSKSALPPTTSMAAKLGIVDEWVMVRFGRQFGKEAGKTMWNPMKLRKFGSKNLVGIGYEDGIRQDATWYRRDGGWFAWDVWKIMDILPAKGSMDPELRDALHRCGVAY